MPTASSAAVPNACSVRESPVRSGDCSVPAGGVSRCCCSGNATSTFSSSEVTTPTIATASAGPTRGGVANAAIACVPPTNSASPPPSRDSRSNRATSRCSMARSLASAGAPSSSVRSNPSRAPPPRSSRKPPNAVPSTASNAVGCNSTVGWPPSSTMLPKMAAPPNGTPRAQRSGIFMASPFGHRCSVSRAMVVLATTQGAPHRCDRRHADTLLSRCARAHAAAQRPAHRAAPATRTTSGPAPQRTDRSSPPTV